MQLALLLLVQILLLFLLSRSLERQLSVFLIQLVRSPKFTVWLMALLYLPGTLVHELAHLIVARLLLVRAGHLTIFPKIENDRVVLGSVLIPKTDSIRRFIIGVAPVLVGLLFILLTMWLAEKYQFDSLMWRIIAGYIIFEISNTLFASKADMEGALGLFAVFALLIGGAYWLGFRLSVDWVSSWINQYQSVLDQSVRWLWLPLIIDGVAVVILGIFNQLLRK